MDIVLRKNIGDLLGVFKKINKNIAVETNTSMKQYIEKANAYEEEIYGNLVLYRNEPVVVWGLGTFTQRLLANNVLKNIVALIDSNPKYSGKKYKGIPIISPNLLGKYSEPIILSVSSRYIQPIINTIKLELKADNKIIKICKDYDFSY